MVGVMGKFSSAIMARIHFSRGSFNYIRSIPDPTWRRKFKAFHLQSLICSPSKREADAKSVGQDYLQRRSFGTNYGTQTSINLNSLRLEGKVAIITGAASGIGEATARVFAENGASVVVADIQDELGLKVVASIAGPDHRAIYKNCDVTVEKQVEETVAFAVEKYGKLDIMYSNAGILGPTESILDMDMEKGFDRTMAVNLRGSANCIKHAARAMVKAQVKGSIICTASSASVLGGLGSLGYTASKHGLVGLVRGAASELGKHGIRVNCVSPHFVATPLVMPGMSALGIKDPSAAEALLSSAGNLKGIALNAKHVAEAALFLASDESVSVSGLNLSVDGGFTVVDSSIAMFMENALKTMM